LLGEIRRVDGVISNLERELQELQQRLREAQRQLTTPATTMRFSCSVLVVRYEPKRSSSRTSGSTQKPNRTSTK
jgi:hypothetical protein